MHKKFTALLLLILTAFIHAESDWVGKSLFDNNLNINILKEWKQESFNISGIKTEQFTNRGKSIILSFFLENKDNKSFKEYLEYRYDAAKIEVWKEIRAKYKFSINYENDYKIYDYNYKTKNKGKFKKFVICINGIEKYLTVTMIVKNEILNEKTDLLNKIFNSIKIKTAAAK